MRNSFYNANYRTRTISITSGKGGVGKTTVVANLAYSLGARGKSVLIFDGDLGMANVDIMFGIRAQKSLQNVLNRECDLKDILVEVAPKVWLIPGGSGVRDFQNMSSFERRALLDAVATLNTTFDYMLIDTAPGITDNVLYLNSAAQTTCVVITPDPASFADSYALIKVLNQEYQETRFSILSNQVKDETEGLSLFKKFNEIAGKFLYIGLDYAGSIPNDPNLRKAVQGQRLIVKQEPNSISSLALQSISSNLEGSSKTGEVKGGLQFFWEQLVGVA
ncbi:MAG: MinD/ParA family protein [Pseudobdellovibrionaceae bacterium]